MPYSTCDVMRGTRLAPAIMRIPSSPGARSVPTRLDCRKATTLMALLRFIMASPIAWIPSSVLSASGMACNKHTSPTTSKLRGMRTPPLPLSVPLSPCSISQSSASATGMLRTASTKRSIFSQFRSCRSLTKEASHSVWLLAKSGTPSGVDRGISMPSSPQMATINLAPSPVAVHVVRPTFLKAGRAADMRAAAADKERHATCKMNGSKRSHTDWSLGALSDSSLLVEGAEESFC
mmetsp:Transcript_26476/g.55391  ORF Transcript_26476/g.55391 Transcript_26476/m.55391 type:complete len:235 (-) Transcript_26476:544-1248(-)